MTDDLAAGMLPGEARLQLSCDLCGNVERAQFFLAKHPQALATAIEILRDRPAELWAVIRQGARQDGWRCVDYPDGNTVDICPRCRLV